MAKYLIIRFSSIGDIVLTSPIPRCLKKHDPNCEIHYLTKEQYAGILESNPNIDRVITFQSDLKTVLKELKSQQYDQIIDLHNNLRSSRVKRALSAKAVSFPKLNYQKFILTNFKINRMPKGLHIVDRYFKTVEGIGVKNDQEGLDYFIPESDKVAIGEHGISEEFIAFSIGAKFNTKKMPTEKILEIIQGLNKQVVLLGGKEDLNEAEIITSKNQNVISLVGQLELNQTASVISQASKVITFDTGLMHIASAFKKPIVSIWGNTVPDFGMYPYLPGQEDLFSIHEVDVKCRPCSKIGYQECPKKHFKCMMDQDVKNIQEKANA